MIEALPPPPTPLDITPLVQPSRSRPVFARNSLQFVSDNAVKHRCTYLRAVRLKIFKIIKSDLNEV